MDARLKMSGMTDFFHHPCMLVSGIPLPFDYTRSVWRVCIFFPSYPEFVAGIHLYKPKMDSR